jgi:hypothetical protein
MISDFDIELIGWGPCAEIYRMLHVRSAVILVRASHWDIAPVLSVLRIGLRAF